MQKVNQVVYLIYNFLRTFNHNRCKSLIFLGDLLLNLTFDTDAITLEEGWSRSRKGESKNNVELLSPLFLFPIPLESAS
jgi:hypothetical protein